MSTRLDPHPEVSLEERLVDDRAGDAHRDAAEGQVRLAAHHGGGEARPSEAEELLLDVVRDDPVARVLDVAAVDPEGRQALLRVGGEDGREVHGARSLRAVEAPDRLGRERVHVHRLGPVAPARRDGDRHADALEPEQLGDLGRLVDAADVVVGDDDLDGRCRRGSATTRGSARRCARAIARVWPSSDSRTPCCRPSTAGRIPIFGQSPTKRPVVLMVAMWILSRTRGGFGPPGGGAAGSQSGVTTPIVSSRLAYSRSSPVAIAKATSGPRAAS